ncbi:MAG: ABC transporter permease [Acidimicrobiales bacterium]
MRPLGAQIRAEVAMTLQRGETLLVTLGIPVCLLVFFSYVNVLPTGDKHAVDFLAPGVLALAVMSTAMVSLGIATGFERSYGVLKRLGTTPLGRPRLLAAKIVSVVAVEAVQVVVLVLVAVAIGWRPHVTAGTALAAELLATVAFAGIGLLMAGALRAELNLAVANGIYLVLLLIGGIVFPVSKLGGFAVVAKLLPAAALSGALQSSLGHPSQAPVESLVVLAAWAVLAPVVAAVTFRFE